MKFYAILIIMLLSCADISFAQNETKLSASDSAPGNKFGYSVSIYGDIALVGAYCNSDGGWESGSAYIFTRTANVWAEQQKLTASDAAVGDRFGYSVSLYGVNALVGAWEADGLASSSGAAFVFNLFSEIFLDGFETGDTTRWSSTMP